MKKTPSLAQARKLAWMWQSEMGTNYSEDGGYNDPTSEVLWREAWIEPAPRVEKTLSHSGAHHWTRCRISEKGLSSLARALTKIAR